jgi:hypothetical protein
MEMRHRKLAATDRTGPSSKRKDIVETRPVRKGITTLRQQGEYERRGRETIWCKTNVVGEGEGERGRKEVEKEQAG